jgi:hypothetical protein
MREAEMTQPPMTDQQLMDFSGEHLMHELSMLRELAAILPRRKAGTETSAFIESFGVHLRNLIDFFYRRGKDDDVTAQDFLDAGIQWNPSEPVVLKDARARANKELNHLTQLRKSGTPKDKEWDTATLLREIDAVARDFAANASPKKLHGKVFEFLKEPTSDKVVWIAANVSHSNVAAHVLSGSNTATVLTHPAPPIQFNWITIKKP